jgi:cyclopropane fatty-acyl-phospholipid synthase-like methyltransferase
MKMRMIDPSPEGAKTAPAAARNRGPIFAVLQPRLPNGGVVLEIASGAGMHAAFIAAALPGVQWQPTDRDPEALDKLAAAHAQTGLPNLLPPLRLDAADPDTWPVTRADAIVNINMIHISPWAATEGLMTGAGRLLPVGGILFLYGPYIEPEIETVASNLAFDLDLKSRNPAWGLRNITDVTALAARHRLALAERVAMPANNLALIFRKTAP